MFGVRPWSQRNVAPNEAFLSSDHPDRISRDWLELAAWCYVAVKVRWIESDSATCPALGAGLGLIAVTAALRIAHARGQGLWGLDELFSLALATGHSLEGPRRLGSPLWVISSVMRCLVHPLICATIWSMNRQPPRQLALSVRYCYRTPTRQDIT